MTDTNFPIDNDPMDPIFNSMNRIMREHRERNHKYRFKKLDSDFVRDRIYLMQVAN